MILRHYKGDQMKALSLIKYLTVVGVLVVTLPNQVLAQTTTAEALMMSEMMNNRQDRQAAKCKEAMAELKDAQKSYDKMCRQVTLPSGASGKKNCLDVAKACSKSMSSASMGNSMDQMAQMAGSMMGVPLPSLSAFGKACVNPIGSDYNRNKKDLEKQIRDLEKEKKDNQGEMIDAEKDFNDKNKEAKQKITDARKELTEKKFELKKEVRELAATKLEAQQTHNDEVMKLNKDMQEKRQSLSTIEQKKAARLMDAESSRDECIEKVQAKIQQMMKNTRSAVGGVGSGRGLREEKARLKGQLDSCTKAAQQAQIAINKSTYNEIESTTKEIADLESKRADSVTALETAMKNFQEQEKDLQQQGLVGEQELQILTQSETQDLQAAYKEMQDTMTSLAQDNRQIDMQIMNLRMQLMNTSVADVPSDNEDAINASNPSESVGSAYEAAAMAEENVRESCPKLQNSKRLFSGGNSSGTK